MMYRTTKKGTHMEIKIEKREVYGVVRYYPKSEGAELLVSMNNRKTLSLNMLRTAKALGHTVTMVTPTWETQADEIADDFQANLRLRSFKRRIGLAS